MFSQKITLKSDYLKEERTINISLPDNYDSSKTNYPVVYVFDGDVLFDYVSALFKYNYDIYPQAIIVGVNQKERHKELVPFENEEKIHNNFLKFINKELLPKIESDYKTNNFNVLIGHSFGGYFSIRCLLENQKINYAISISPTIWGKYEKNIDSVLNDYSPVTQKKIYLGIADNDHKTLKKGVIKLSAFIKNSKLKIDNHLKEFKEEDHNSSILIGTRKGLSHIFENWPTILPSEKWDDMETKKDPSIFYNYFDEVSKQSGKIIIPSEEDYNYLGYFYLEVKKFSEAIAVFKENTLLYPCSSNAYDSLAEAYAMNNNFKKAISYYKKAVKVEKKSDNNKILINQYQNKIKDLKSKIN